MLAIVKFNVVHKLSTEYERRYLNSDGITY